MVLHTAQSCLKREETAADDAVGEEVLSRILEPYKSHCKYLKRASLERGGYPNPPGEPPRVLSGHGWFSIPESCYIADTGHFNAVEFNICFNQLAYTLVAAAVARGSLAVLSHFTFDEFCRRQLSDCVIANFSSEFPSAMRRDEFYGNLHIERVSVRKGTVFMKTICEFRDHRNGRSSGQALLAVVNGARGNSRGNHDAT
jgi:hypothetical protein